MSIRRKERNTFIAVTTANMTSEFLRPTLNRISLPPSCCTTKIDSNGDTILPSLDILTSLLSSEECKSLIIAHDIEAELHDISGTYTTRLRKVFDDEVLADLLWSRLSQFYEKLRVVDEEGQTWCAEGLNQCFRFCKYRAGKSSLYFCTSGSLFMEIYSHCHKCL